MLNPHHTAASCLSLAANKLYIVDPHLKYRRSQIPHTMLVTVNHLYNVLQNRYKVCAVWASWAAWLPARAHSM